MQCVHVSESSGWSIFGPIHDSVLVPGTSVLGDHLSIPRSTNRSGIEARETFNEKTSLTIQTALSASLLKKLLTKFTR